MLFRNPQNLDNRNTMQFKLEIPNFETLLFCLLGVLRTDFFKVCWRFRVPERFNSDFSSIGDFHWRGRLIQSDVSIAGLKIDP